MRTGVYCDLRIGLLVRVGITRVFVAAVLSHVFAAFWRHFDKTSCARGRHNMPPPLASWPLTLKVVSESLWRGLPLCQF